MDVVKPFQLMVKQTVIEQDNRFHFVASVSLGFRLSTGETLLENDVVSESFAAMGASPMPDMGMPKPKAEYLVSGKYYAPGGEPVSGGEVKVEFDGKQKSIYVFGDRQWLMGVPSEAELITEMPLDYAHAYGGGQYAKNPQGIGYQEERLPNIENPDQLLTSAKANIAPAGLGILDVRAQQRLQYQGTYDDSYLQKYYPGYPADFDWHSFMCTAPDQWSDTYYSGSESFALHNLHPEKPYISGRLPGLQAHCFIQEKHRDNIQEIKLNLDTVWFFPEQDLGLLIWRGGVDVDDDEAESISHIMAAYQHSNEPVHDEQYFQQAFDYLSSGDDRLIKQLSSETLMAANDQCAMQIFQERAGSHAEESEFGKNLEAKAEAVSEVTTAKIEELLKEIKSQTPEQSSFNADEVLQLDDFVNQNNPLKKDPDVELLNQKLEQLLPGITSGDPKKIQFRDFTFDKLDDIMQEVENLLQRKQDFSLQQIASVKQELQSGLETELQGMAKVSDENIVNTQQTLDQLNELDNPPPVPLPRLNSKIISDELDQLTPHTLEAMQNLQTLKAMGTDVESMQEMEAMLRQSTAEQEQLRKESLQEIEQQFKEMYRETAHFQPDGESPHKNTLSERRQEFLDRINKGASVANQDWACLDLSGLDLIGIDLSNAYLEQVDFSGSNLATSNFSGAILARAKLDKANLGGSNFSQANIGAVSARETSFIECDLSEAKLSRGDFSGADFTAAQLQEVETLEITLDQANFTQASLVEFIFLKMDIKGAKFSEANLSKCNFIQCQLNQCDFSNASLPNSIWAETGLAHCTFNGANMPGACFAATDYAKAKLEQISFVGACLDKANFQGMDMQRADLSSASLNNCNFSSANLTGANLRNCNAQQAMFRKAELGHARLENINLNQGSMAKAHLSGAVATGANLYAVDFLRSTVGDTLFNDCNLDNTIIQDWRPD